MGYPPRPPNKKNTGLWLLLGCGGVKEDSEADIKAKGEDNVPKEMTPEQKKEAEKSGFDPKSFDNPTPTGGE